MYMCVHAHIVYTSFMYMYSTIYIYMTWSNLAEIHTEESVLAAPPRNIQYIVLRCALLRVTDDPYERENGYVM
jgi:hypothetical protein